MAKHISNMDELAKALQPVMIGMVDELAERVYETLNYFLQEYYNSYDPKSYQRQYDFLRSDLVFIRHIGCGNTVCLIFTDCKIHLFTLYDRNGIIYSYKIRKCYGELLGRGILTSMNEKKINTGNLKIENNIISFGKTLLQINNISEISVEQVNRRKLELWPIIVIIVGGMAVQGIRELKYLVLLFVIAGVVYIGWSIYVYLNDEKQYLHIYMNSGSVYTMYCESNGFLKRVLDEIKECINHPHVQNVKVDFNNCEIKKSPIIIGNKKGVTSPIIIGDNNSLSINNWNLIQDELRKVYMKLPEMSVEYQATEEALEYALNKDKEGLIHTFKKYSASFLSDLFSGVASGILLEIIKNIIWL